MSQSEEDVDRQIGEAEEYELLLGLNEELVNEIARLTANIEARDEVALNQVCTNGDFVDVGVCFYCWEIDGKHTETCPTATHPLKEN